MKVPPALLKVTVVTRCPAPVASMSPLFTEDGASMLRIADTPFAFTTPAAWLTRVMPLFPMSPRPEILLFTLVKTEVPDGRRMSALVLVKLICPPPVSVSEPAMFNQVPEPVESISINPRLVIFPLRVSWLLLPTMTVEFAPMKRVPEVGV